MNRNSQFSRRLFSLIVVLFFTFQPIVPSISFLAKVHAQEAPDPATTTDQSTTNTPTDNPEPTQPDPKPADPIPEAPKADEPKKEEPKVETPAPATDKTTESTQPETTPAPSTDSTETPTGSDQNASDSTGTTDTSSDVPTENLNNDNLVVDAPPAPTSDNSTVAPAPESNHEDTQSNVVTTNNNSEEEVWNISADGKTVTTNNPVVLNQKYTFPSNANVSVTFTSLPENPGTLTIKQLQISNALADDLNAFGTTAYEITSTMLDGTFTYNLTLPAPSSASEVEVVYAETSAGLNNATEVKNNIKKNTSNVEIFGLNHFTVFVVADPTLGADNNGVGTQTWNNPTTIYTSDNNFATVSVPAGTTTHYLMATNFGLAIPNTATIEGIEVFVERSVNQTRTLNTHDSVVELIKGGTVTGTNHAAVGDWPDVDTTKTYGSNVDLWGTTLTAADVNATNFGVAISATRNSPDAPGQNARVDYVHIKVYYSIPANTAPTITVTAPNGGESYNIASSPVNITWTASDVDATDTLTIDLAYSTDGVNYTPIATGLANSGTYAWTLPTLESTNVTIKATANDGTTTTSDVSDAVFSIDTIAPVVTEVTPVPTPGTDTTPDYTFNTTQAGTITYGGSCSSATSAAVIGSNTVTFNALADGTYSNCTVTVTDPAGNPSNVLAVTPFTIDTTGPVLTEVTPVTTPTADTTPDYTFNSNEAGTITYGGSCSSATGSAIVGDNTITFNTLPDGTYSNCTITVTDALGNVSNVLAVTPFTIDTTVSISGTKWNDMNGNAAKDGGEPGLQNWTIFIDLDNNGTLDGGEVSTSTDVNGDYSFTGLVAGTYVICEVQQAGWTQMFPLINACHTVDASTPGAKITGTDFGNFQLGVITGMKFNDLNGNGALDGGETGLENVNIYIDANNNQTFDGGELFQSTDVNGDYSFTDLPAGTYAVCESGNDPTWWLQTYPSTNNGCNIVNIVNSGDTSSGNNFGNFQLNSLDGAKWNDLNGDGAWDLGEPGLQGWTIFDDANNNGTLDGGEVSTTTDANGLYIMLSLNLGTHYICEVQQAGWTQTYPTTNNGCNVFDVTTSGDSFTSENFGNFQTAVVNGLKYNDLNANGSQDGGEPGLEGWTIFADANNNATLDGGEISAVTDVNGNYSFNGLTLGSYQICEVAQASWTQVSPSSPSCYAIIVTTSGTTFNNKDFGNVQYTSVDGFKFVDANGNGAMDGGEINLDGWNIYLYNANWNQVTSMQTGDDSTSAGAVATGEYKFVNLTAGTYYICEGTVSGWTQTRPFTGAGGFTVVDENTADSVEPKCYQVDLVATDQATALDFGNFEYITVSGFKFDDSDANGTWDGGENGLDGWTIFADANGNKILDGGEVSTITALDGSYTLSLLPGDYDICEVQKNGWKETFPGTTCYNISISTSGDKLTDYNFGNTELSSIDGEKFNDVDADGAHGFLDDFFGGGSLDGWTMYLYDANWTQVDSMQTGDDTTVAGPLNTGEYKFENLVAGTYYVCEANVAGWVQTLPTSGVTESTTDNVATYCLQVDLPEAANVTDYDFGNFKLGSVSGTKWEDSDMNGSIDSGEQPIEGVTIFIDANFNKSLDGGETTTTTDVNGNYSFTGLTVGLYQICEVIPTGSVQTYPGTPSTPDCHFGPILSGWDVTGIDFGNVGYAHITIVKDVLDANGNAVDDLTGTKFGFAISGTADTASLADGETSTIFDVLPGTYNVIENLINTNYSFDHCDAEYDGEAVGISILFGKTVDLDGGDSVTVTCYNRQKPTTITVYKNVVDLNKPGINISDPTKFTVNLKNNADDSTVDADQGDNKIADTSTDPIPNASDTATFSVPIGSYTLTETSKPGYINMGCYEVGLAIPEGIKPEVAITPGLVTTGINQDITVVCTNEIPVKKPNKLIAVKLTGNSPAFDGPSFMSLYTIFAPENTDFKVTTFLDVVGDSPFDYTFSGKCQGTANNLAATSFVTSNTLNLPAGIYDCFIHVVDSNGDFADSYAPLIIFGIGGGNGPFGNGEFPGAVNGASTEGNPVNGAGGEVLGTETTCDAKDSVEISGDVYVRSNENSKKDSDEEAVEEATVRIYYFDKDNNRVLLITLKTDADGHWKTKVCPGKYEVEVDKDTLPKEDSLVGENVQEINVSKSVDGINFEMIVPSNNGKGFQWWWILIGLLIILLLLAIGYAISRRREDEQEGK